MIPLLINQSNIARDFSLQLSKYLVDSDLAVIGLTGIGPILTCDVTVLDCQITCDVTVLDCQITCDVIVLDYQIDFHVAV
jgi:hypothetical protein